MNFKQYKNLRDTSYSFVGELGTVAELENDEKVSTGLSIAYQSACLMLDDIDELGYRLGFLDPETNEETPKGHGKF